MAEPLPSPGSRHGQAFTAEPGKCWAVVHDVKLQATHCHEPPAWTGRWRSPGGDRWWIVWSCPEHLEGLTGVRSA